MYICKNNERYNSDRPCVNVAEKRNSNFQVYRRPFQAGGPYSRVVPFWSLREISQEDGAIKWKIMRTASERARGHQAFKYDVSGDYNDARLL